MLPSTAGAEGLAGSLDLLEADSGVNSMKRFSTSATAIPDSMPMSRPEVMTTTVFSPPNAVRDSGRSWS